MRIFFFFDSAEVWFQNLNTGEDIGLNQSCLSFGKDRNLACMTGGFHPIYERWFLFHFLATISVMGLQPMNGADLGQIWFNLGSHILRLHLL